MYFAGCSFSPRSPTASPTGAAGCLAGWRLHLAIFDRHRIRSSGIDKKRIAIDPGFGFGKTLAHNLELLARLESFRVLECPLLVGLSRKRSIGELTGRQDPSQRVHGSVAAALIAAQRGAVILRVHDVAATRDALAVWEAVRAVAPLAPPKPKSPLAGLFDDD